LKLQFHHFSKIKINKEVKKIEGIKDPDPYLVLKDPDPGGPKTYGSGSATLAGKIGQNCRLIPPSLLQADPAWSGG
jgi:hypothetical protein